jgi:ATP-dependent Lhr-like helicase
MMLAGDKESRLILLAGKSWRITDVDWKRQTVWLEPAKEGGKARWTGSGRTLSRQIAQGILRALRNGASTHAVISKRARLQIEQLVAHLPNTGGTSTLSMIRDESGSARLWTFAGTRANRTIAKQIQSLAEIRRIDALGIDIKTFIDLKALNTDLLAADLKFSTDEIKERAKPIKFSQCIPVHLLTQIIRLRQFEETAVVAPAIQ